MALKLQLSAYGAMMVALVLTLSAAAHTIRGTNLWIHSQVDRETLAMGDFPFEMEYFEQERSRSVRTAMTSIAVGILLAVGGVVCGFYAWQLRTAALGRRQVEDTLIGQTVCWFLAAMFSVVYLISHVWVF
jgi:hypothetical protein